MDSLPVSLSEVPATIPINSDLTKRSTEDLYLAKMKNNIVHSTFNPFYASNKGKHLFYGFNNAVKRINQRDEKLPEDYLTLLVPL